MGSIMLMFLGTREVRERLPVTDGFLCAQPLTIQKCAIHSSLICDEKPRNETQILALSGNQLEMKHKYYPRISKRAVVDHREIDSRKWVENTEAKEGRRR